MKRLILAMILLLAPALALAANMSECNSATGRSYVTKAHQLCFILCNGVGTGSGTSCGPSTLPMKDTHHYANLIVGFGNADAACTTGSFSINWCATASCAAPRVGQTFATLTGAAVTDTSSIEFNSPPGSVYQATFSAIGDADCNANGGVDVFMLIDELD